MKAVQFQAEFGRLPLCLNGKYQLLEHIGYGGFATVLKAVDADGKEYAVKAISRRRSHGPPGYIDQIVGKEVDIMETLSHPNIVGLVEVLECRNWVFLVMEYMDGGDLLDYILRVGACETPHARYIFQRVVEAISHIHGAKVGHRDLKLENIMLGSGDVVKVTDFGLSIALRTENELRETRVGTPYYQAPEILCGEQYSPLMADVWSLGVILYALLSGTYPFRSSTSDVDGLRRDVLRYSPPWDVIQDPGAENLLKKIFKPEAERITLPEIMSHPWFRHDYEPIGEPTKCTIERSVVTRPLSDDLSGSPVTIFDILGSAAKIDVSHLVLPAAQVESRSRIVYLSQDRVIEILRGMVERERGRMRESRNAIYVRGGKIRYSILEVASGQLVVEFTVIRGDVGDFIRDIYDRLLF